MRQRVVITGLGAVTPVGLTVDEFWRGLVEGRSGARPITRFDASAFSTRFAAELQDFDPGLYMERKEIRRNDPFTHYAIAATRQALDHSRLDTKEANGERIATIVGSGIGGTTTWEAQHRTLIEKGPDRVSPFFIPMMIANMASGQVSIEFGLRGANFATVSACSSGAHAIGEAFKLVRDGEIDAAVAGGSEASITPLSVAGFCALKALSARNDAPEKASRPFDKGRDGFVMGEGAGMLVLEAESHALARGAAILGELVGYGSTADAHHITAPAPDGSGAARAMRGAMRSAGIGPGDVDYVNAHGTSTELNDKFETKALHTVFGAHAPKLLISSTKSMTGHLLGAAGAIELVACVMAIQHGVVPPTINQETPDPDCDLDYVPNVARRATVRVALSNSLGFGGHNVSLIVRRYEPNP